MQITSSNVNGESIKSDLLTVYIATIPNKPAIPTETEITLSSDSLMSVLVSWTEPTDSGAPVTGYELWMSEEQKQYEIVFDGRQRADLLNYLVQNLNRGLNYTFKILAINYVGKSEFSDELHTLAAVVPSAPLNFNVTNSMLGSVSLEWNEPEFDGGSELLGYYTYYKLTGVDAEWTMIEPMISDEFNQF